VQSSSITTVDFYLSPGLKRRGVAFLLVLRAPAILQIEERSKHQQKSCFLIAVEEKGQRPCKQSGLMMDDEMNSFTPWAKPPPALRS
jgi:hypothetical protein